jgi:hypothetical protein
MKGEAPLGLNAKNKTYKKKTRLKVVLISGNPAFDRYRNMIFSELPRKFPNIYRYWMTRIRVRAEATSSGILFSEYLWILLRR